MTPTIFVTGFLSIQFSSGSNALFIKKIYLMQMQPSIDTVFSCLQTSFIVDFFSQTLRYKIEEEVRVNSEIETYLRQHHEVK